MRKQSSNKPTAAPPINLEAQLLADKRERATRAKAATALLSGATMVLAGNETTTTFTITAGATGLVAATTYSWNYVVVQ